MFEVIAFFGGILGAAIIIRFLQAITVKVATGKWPHEMPEAERLYRTLP